MLAPDDRPAISVIVPTWNRPCDLAACLRAIAALDYPGDRFEVIVVDDGSEPPVAPLDVSGRAGVRTTLLRQSNAGPSAARNAGARVATGEILAFTDDDCLPARDWLCAIADALARDPAALHGGRVDNALADNPWSVASQTITEVIIPHLMATGSALRFHTSNNLALSADAYRAVGGFDERFRTAEDREFCRRWIAAGRRIAAMPAAVVRHRHFLTGTSFWRQHFGYGRGAYRFHALRASAPRSLFHEGLEMGTRTFRRPFASMPVARAAGIASRLVLWQVANACGYAWQWAQDLRQRRTARGGDGG